MGIEYSGRLMDAAHQFLSKGHVQWNDTVRVPLPDKVERRNNVNFKQVRTSLNFNGYVVIIIIVDMDTQRDSKL